MEVAVHVAGVGEAPAEEVIGGGAGEDVLLALRSEGEREERGEGGEHGRGSTANGVPGWGAGVGSRCVPWAERAGPKSAAVMHFHIDGTVSLD